MTRILIIEDDLIIGGGLKAFLRSEGMDTLQVASGEEAIDAVERYRPDLLLMDIKLKGKMDGIETAERIQRRHDIPLIYLTEHTDQATFGSAKRTYPHSYLAKPFSNGELLRAIELAMMQEHRAEARQPAVDARAEDGVFIYTGGAYQKLRFEDLLYLEANGAYTHVFFTETGKPKPAHLVVSLSSNRVVRQLEHAPLVRVHRSYYVNVRRIVRIHDKQVDLENATVPLASIYRSALLERIQRLSRK